MVMDAFLKAGATLAWLALVSLPGLAVYGISYQIHKKEWNADER